jgi:hypothetical protein
MKVESIINAFAISISRYLRPLTVGQRRFFDNTRKYCQQDIFKKRDGDALTPNLWSFMLKSYPKSIKEIFKLNDTFCIEHFYKLLLLVFIAIK